MRTRIYAHIAGPIGKGAATDACFICLIFRRAILLAGAARPWRCDNVSYARWHNPFTIVTPNPIEPLEIFYSCPITEM